MDQPVPDLVHNDRLHRLREAGQDEAADVLFVDHVISDSYPAGDLDLQLRAVAKERSVLRAHCCFAVHQHVSAEVPDGDVVGIAAEKAIQITISEGRNLPVDQLGCCRDIRAPLVGPVPP
jgi:hypothetical protein